MIYLKIKSEDELNGKIIAMTDNYPDRLYVEGGPNPSLWALLDPKPIKEGSYDMFYDLFAEDRKNWVDGDIKIFNAKLRNDDFQMAKIKTIYTVCGTQFIILDMDPEMCFILMMAHMPFLERPDMKGGKAGYYWTEDFYEKHVRKDLLRKTFRLSPEKCDRLIWECRKKK